MSFLKSSIGRKILMALTGLALVGFVVAHMVGNLQIFIGQKVFNDYAAMLKGMPAVLWPARLGLLAFVFIHVATAISLSRQNQNARPKAYRAQTTVQASAASRYMFHSGIIILVFIGIHLAHFTLGYLQPEFYEIQDQMGRHDVYSMVIHGFQTVPFSIFYIVAMICLGSHLSHAMASMFQTVGISGPSLTPKIEVAVKGLTALIVLGYISIPVSVLVGLIGLPQ
jgi:succinate dehydrogenase / fumarate reductase cytochrome b subunit